MAKPVSRKTAAFGLRMGVTPKVGQQMKAGKSSGAAAGRECKPKGGK